MAADSDGSDESLTTVVTCEGDLADPEFPARFDEILEQLRALLCEESGCRAHLCVRKLEPWNSVRVTLTVPRDAALRLRQLAAEGSQQLRALGILSVQVEGDQVISLRLATRFGQEPHEIVLRTGTQDGSVAAASDDSTVVSGLTRIITSAQNIPGPAASTTSIHLASPSTSTASTPVDPPPPVSDKVQFRSPNVVCPTDTQVPKPPAVVPPVASSPGVTQRSYTGPFPFASMTHAAQAIHSREQLFTQPPPPYPTQPTISATPAATAVATATPVVKTISTPNSPNVAMSSPLLVNLLQNDGAQVVTKVQSTPNSEQRKVVTESTSDGASCTNSAFVQTPPPPPPPPSPAIKYPTQVATYVPTAPQIRPVGPRVPTQAQISQPFVSQTVPKVMNTVRPPLVQQRPPLSAVGGVGAGVGVQQKFTSFPRHSVRVPALNYQQPHFPSPPPYPRQRIETPRHMRWQTPPIQLEQMVQPIAHLQPIAQPMPHLGSLLDNSLSNITPSLTDLSKTDLDSLLDGELVSALDIPDLQESLTSSGKRRQYLINPLTGVLEPMPSDTSGSDSEPDQSKETDVFNDFNSPLNDRSNSVYSDDDTCSTTISRKFDTTDQSDSETTVKSTNSDNSVKSHARTKVAKNRDRNRDSPSLKKNKDLPTEKIKLRLKLEKSEPVSPAYKVDISFINTQQPKRATTQQPPGAEELRVPPLHISLRGRNSVVINAEKKKKYAKFNADGSVLDLKKLKKTVEGGLKVKKLPIDGAVINDALGAPKPALIKNELILPGTSSPAEHSDSKLGFILKNDLKPIKPIKLNDVDDLPLNYRMKEPGEIIPASKLVKKKTTKLNHTDIHREQNLLAGGHLVDDYKSSYKKPKCVEKPTSEHNKFGCHIKKEKFKEKVKERLLPGHIGEIRRGSDSDVVKGLKRHADSNGLSHLEKKRRLSHSEGKINVPTLTESQGVNKSVKLKSSSPDGHISTLSSSDTLVHQTVVGSTNVGTITTATAKTLSKSYVATTTTATDDKIRKTITKFRRDKIASVSTNSSTLLKTKIGGNFKTKDLNRDKSYAQNVAEKLAKQLPLPIGEIDMEAKFKQSLLESSDVPRRYVPPNEIIQCKHDLVVQTLTDTSVTVASEQRNDAKKELDSPDRKEPELVPTQHSGRSPNGGGQGEDSGIESMDALSEKSPNQASQSPHSHTDITLVEMKSVKAEPKLENCDLLDIEEQLAKMDGLPTLNGDLSHRIKTEPFMKTETLIEKLEGTEGKDLNENKEHIKEVLLDGCCELKSKSSTECKIETKPGANIKDEKTSVGPPLKSSDFDPLPVRRKPPLYTYSNPEKQSRDSESPIPNLSDLESDQSDCNSECSDLKKCNAKATRRRLVEPCVEDYLNELAGFKKNEIVKKTPKSLLEQLLIEIPSEVSDKSSISPSVSEKKSSIRTRSSSKLNSPDSSCQKTPKPDSPTNSPKISPKAHKTLVPVKRKRQESESSTQSNVSMDEASGRSKKTRKCSENAVELIKACMGVETPDSRNLSALKTSAKESTVKKTLRKSQSQLADLESSDSDEPLIEVAGKVRNKNVVATRNKLNSTKSSMIGALKTALANAPNRIGTNAVNDEKTVVGTRRSVRNNNTNAHAAVLFKTRSKQLQQQLQQLQVLKVAEKGSVAGGGVAGAGTAQVEVDANRRKTRSAVVTDDSKRRRNSRDSK